MYTPALILLCAGVALAQYQCPAQEDGYFVDPNQCDKYYDCYRGKQTEKMCPDGLVFDYNRGTKVERCEYPFLVDCDQNKSLQPAQPSGPNKECPRQNGFFEHEEISNCMEYYECTNGIFVLRRCSEGLVFDEFTGRCVWATTEVRTGCAPAKLLVLANGFSCDQPAQRAGNGQAFDHSRFIDQEDCRKFYVCRDGKFPEAHGCPDGSVFDDVKLECAAPETVPGCECYYYAPGECPYENPQPNNSLLN